MAELTSQHTGQTVEQVTRDSDRDRWFDPAEAKAYGLIDDVISTARRHPGRRRHQGLTAPRGRNGPRKPPVDRHSP